jgi:hypothetical protein
MIDTPRSDNQGTNQLGEARWKQSGLAVPGSPLIDHAIEYCRQHYEPSLFNHVIRSWIYAVRIARTMSAQVDDDVIAVSVLLHDLGLTPAFAGPDRFEVEGANAARQFAFHRGVNNQRCQLIWDSVALHAIPSINAHKEPEVAICGAGIAVDHDGSGLDQIPSEELSVILDAFPRLGLKRVLKSCFCRLAQTKPASSHDGLVRDFGSRFVAGYRSSSGADAILNAPFETS